MATPCCKIEPKQHDCELNYCKPGSHRIEIENYGIVYGIVYCPLHQAAPQLWAACQATLQDWKTGKIPLAQLSEAIEAAQGTP